MNEIKINILKTIINNYENDCVTTSEEIANMTVHQESENPYYIKVYRMLVRNDNLNPLLANRQTKEIIYLFKAYILLKNMNIMMSVTNVHQKSGGV